MTSAPPSPGSDLARGLLRLARRLAGAQDADDLVQSTWVRVLERGTAGVRAPAAWLREVLRNEHRMALRSERRAQDRIGEPAFVTDDGEHIVAQREIAAILALLVAQLDHEVRNVVEQRYFAERSAAEIARAEAIPAGTVRWRLKLGLDRLRSELDAHHGGKRALWAGAFLPPLIPPTLGSSAASGSAVSAATTAGRSVGTMLVRIAAVAVSTMGGALALAAWPRPADPSPSVATEAGDRQDARAAITRRSQGATERADIDRARAGWQERLQEIRTTDAASGSQEARTADGNDGHSCRDADCAQGLAELVAGCAAWMHQHDAFELTAHAVAAPDGGRVIEHVEIDPPDALSAELAECLVASTHALELAPVEDDEQPDDDVTLTFHASDAAMPIAPPFTADDLLAAPVPGDATDESIVVGPVVEFAPPSDRLAQSGIDADEPGVHVFTTFAWRFDESAVGETPDAAGSGTTPH